MLTKVLDTSASVADASVDRGVEDQRSFGLELFRSRALERLSVDGLHRRIVLSEILRYLHGIR